MVHHAQKDQGPRWGSEIHAIRKRNNLTRHQVVLRYFDIAGEDSHPNDFSESILATIETGTKANFPIGRLEILLQAIQCTDAERILILLYAFDSPFSIKLTSLAILLIRIHDLLYQEMKNDQFHRIEDILFDLVRDPEFSSLTIVDLNTVLTTIIKDTRR